MVGPCVIRRSWEASGHSLPKWAGRRIVREGRPRGTGGEVSRHWASGEPQEVWVVGPCIYHLHPHWIHLSIW